jgi:hypothetical protein
MNTAILPLQVAYNLKIKNKRVLLNSDNIRDGRDNFHFPICTLYIVKIYKCTILYSYLTLPRESLRDQPLDNVLFI